ncbi:Transmembrane protein 43 [Seminavis robusta]|uniref:Transmembrane protein 43 n=1 Tax=Seminavis robusta TaxID=568900 RepID=A0A9N8E896_9STRA|nr:Transmembrane protein 43 [Seminavis robusta]|eukprot:Sro779_g201220.1 Transmembrane protein 43 (495) ;mRNA; r:933-2504
MSDDGSGGGGGGVKNACLGVVIGWLLFFGSIVVMFWNEGRTVKRANDIDEAEERYVSLKLSDIIEADRNSTSSVEDARFALSQYANKLVHITGDISTSVIIQDPLFGINGKIAEDENALKLRREVEMYQWKEDRHTEGSKKNKKTVYTYEKVWSDEHYDSSYFHESGHDNPAFPFREATFTANPILMDDTVALGEPAVDLINWFIPWRYPVNLTTITDEMSAQKKEHLEVSDSGQSFYYHYTVTTSTSNNTRTSSPEVGDTIIGFKVVYPTKISIIAYYDGSRLDEYTTEAERPFILVARGSVDAATMLQDARDENTAIAWALRAIGFKAMFFGICLILQPLAMAADIIPCIGDILSESISGCLIPMVACIISVPLALFVISLGWLWYRPHIAWPLVATGFVLSVGFCWWAKDKINVNSSNHPVPAEIKPSVGVVPENDKIEPDIEIGLPTAVGADQEEPDIPVVVVAQEPDIDLTTNPNNQNDPHVPSIFKAP